MSTLTAIQKTIDAQKESNAVKLTPSSSDTSLVASREVGVLIEGSNATVQNTSDAGSVVIKGGVPNRDSIDGGDITIQGGDGDKGGDVLIIGGENTGEDDKEFGTIKLLTGGSDGSSSLSSGIIDIQTGNVSTNTLSGFIRLQTGTPHTNNGSTSGTVGIYTGGVSDIADAGNSGSIFLYTGQGGLGSSGSVISKTGNTSSANSGSMTFTTGDSTSGITGAISMFSGGSTDGGSSGNINLVSGVLTKTVGPTAFPTGDVLMSSGAGVGAWANSGNLTLKTGLSERKTGSLSIYTGNSGTDVSGDVMINSGNSLSATTGQIDLITGNSISETTGAINLTTGNSTSPSSSDLSGNISLTTGTSGTSNTGSISFTTGNAQVESGNINISTGTGTGGGDINLTTGTGTDGDIILVSDRKVRVDSPTTEFNVAATTTILGGTDVQVSTSNDFYVSAGGDVQVSSTSVPNSLGNDQRMLTVQADGILKSLGIQVLGHGTIRVSFDNATQPDVIHKLPITFSGTEASPSTTFNIGGVDYDTEYGVNQTIPLIEEWYSGIEIINHTGSASGSSGTVVYNHGQDKWGSAITTTTVTEGSDDYYIAEKLRIFVSYNLPGVEGVQSNNITVTGTPILETKIGWWQNHNDSIVGWVSEIAWSYGGVSGTGDEASITSRVGGKKINVNYVIYQVT